MDQLWIACEGLTVKEGRLLQDHLVATWGQSAVHLKRPEDKGQVFTRDAVQAALPHLDLLVRIGEAGFGALATGALSEAGKDLYKRCGTEAVSVIGDWLKTKMTGKSTVPVKVILYGPDGKELQALEQYR